MYPPKFDYYRAGSVAEALDLMKQHDGKFLAGGHSLIPIMIQRLADPGVLIDIGRLDDLRGVSANGSVRLGALTTHAAIANSTEVPQIMFEAAGWIGDPQVRNRGTIGGNVAHADPASDWPTVLTALGAKFHLISPNGERVVEATDFFVDLFMTDLGEGEMITAVEVPHPSAGTGSAYAKMFNPASGYATVGAAAVVTVSGGQCAAAGIAVGGLTPKATKAPSVEAELVGQTLDESTIAAATEAVDADLPDDVDLLTDIHASASYRRAMVKVYLRRAIANAASRA